MLYPESMHPLKGGRFGVRGLPELLTLSTVGGTSLPFFGVLSPQGLTWLGSMSNSSPGENLLNSSPFKENLRQQGV